MSFRLRRIVPLLLVTALFLPAAIGSTQSAPPPPADPMVLVYNTASGSSGTTASLPLYGTVNASVDWGDGTVETFTSEGVKTHAYATSGEKTVSVTGTVSHFGTTDYPGNQDYLNNLVGVTSFGTIGLTSLRYAFCGASSLVDLPDILPLTVTNLENCFTLCTSLNDASLSLWQVDNVTDMSEMFFGAMNFNVNISLWNVGSVTDFNAMLGADNGQTMSFNQPIGSWNTSAATNMGGMFYFSTSFNQDLAGWDVSHVTDMSSMFVHCISFNGDISTWNPASVTNMSGMFGEAGVFNGDLSGWNTSSVTDMSQMFRNASLFDSDLSGWDVSKVTDMYNMFSGSTRMSASSWDATLNGWAAAASIPDNIDMGPVSAARTASSAAAYTHLTDTHGWLISDQGEGSAPFIAAAPTFPVLTGTKAVFDAVLTVAGNPGAFEAGICWDTAADPTTASSHRALTAGLVDGAALSDTIAGLLPNTTYHARAYARNNIGLVYGPQTTFTTADPMILVYHITDVGTPVELPLKGTVDADIDWGDGEITVGYTDDATMPSHTYGSAGTYAISISGTVTHFGSEPDDCYGIASLDTVRSFGDIGLSSLSFAFKNAESLQSVPSTLPSGVTDLSGCFYGCSGFNGALSGWNTANVTDMRRMFYMAGSFNQPVGSWNTSSVTSMASMFASATAFNQPVQTLNTSNVTTMSLMFYAATAFNQPLDTLKTASVTDMYGMFKNASSFNGTLSQWNTANVTTMEAMFYGATSFNRTLGSFNTANVVNMKSMFRGATSFNQPLNTWNTAHVTSMGDMFRGATVFDQALVSFNTANVTDFGGMFRDAASFDQPIDSWDTHSATDMWGMFYGATVFDQPIGTWDLDSVYYIEYMFCNARAFDQDLSGWDIRSVLLTNNMFQGAVSFNGNISTWDMDSVTHLYQMFDSALAFSGDISAWQLDSALDMFAMFRNARSFGGNIGAWNVANVYDMDSMFTGDSLPTAAYDSILVKWGAQSVLSDVKFSGGKSRYSGTAAAAARAHLVGTHAWTITDEGLVRKALTITGLSASGKVYDGTTVATLSGGALSGLASGDSVTLVKGSGAFANKNVGTNKAVTLSGFRLVGRDTAFYTLTVPTGLTATIVKDTLTITAHDVSKILGSSDPVFTATISGLVSADNESVVSGLAFSREVGNTAGDYIITPSGATAANYVILYESGTLTIEQVTEIIAKGEIETGITAPGVYVLGNPVTLGSGKGASIVVATGSAAMVHLQIFDAMGNLIDDQNGESSVSSGAAFDWDLRTQNGDAVSTGIYIAVAQVRYCDGIAKIFKAAVAVKD